MAEGTVKWFDKKKGYGFIAHPDNTDVFVHYTGFASSDLRTLDEGDTVCFDVVEGEKGLRAENVSLKAAATQPQTDPVETPADDRQADTPSQTDPVDAPADDRQADTVDSET